MRPYPCSDISDIYRLFRSTLLFTVLCSPGAANGTADEPWHLSPSSHSHWSGKTRLPQLVTERPRQAAASPSAWAHEPGCCPGTVRISILGISPAACTAQLPPRLCPCSTARFTEQAHRRLCWSPWCVCQCWVIGPDHIEQFRIFRSNFGVAVLEMLQSDPTLARARGRCSSGSTRAPPSSACRPPGVVIDACVRACGHSCGLPVPPPLRQLLSGVAPGCRGLQMCQGVTGPGTVMCGGCLLPRCVGYQPRWLAWEH